MARATTAPVMTVLAAMILTFGCGGPGASPSPSAAATPAGTAGSGGDGPLAVALQEWAVLPSVATAPSGEVTFSVTNNGPDDVHEFVVVKTDLDVHQLPTDADGAVDEAGGGMEVIGEIEDIPVGQTQELVVDLDPGNYALICNIYTAEEDEAHYQMGMRTAFTVTE